MHPVAPSLRLRRPDAPRWRSRAFGLDLDVGFAAPPFPRLHGDENAGMEPTRIDVVYADSIRRAWPRDGSRRTGVIGPLERPVVTVDEHAKAGYLIQAPPYGRYLVSADGRHIACAPPSLHWWRWQRELIAQVIPAAAALRGYELLHASAVRFDGRTIAFAGASGVGKSSLAYEFLCNGGSLVAEDVLTVTDESDRVVAEPGSAMLNVAEDQEIGGGRVGHVVGRSGGKAHLLVEREEARTPLALLYLLSRDDARSPMFEDVRVVSPPEVFQNSFVNYIYRPDRMVRQLDLAALVARTVPVVRLRIRPEWDAVRVAEAVAQHAEASG